MDSFREQVEASKLVHKTQQEITSEIEKRALMEVENAERLIKEAVLREAGRTYQGSSLKLHMGLEIQLPLIGHLEKRLSHGKPTDYISVFNENNPSILVDIEESAEKPFLRNYISTQHIRLTQSAYIIRNQLIERLSSSGFVFGDWKIYAIPGYSWYDGYTYPRVQFDGVVPLDNKVLYPLPITVVRKQSSNRYLQLISDSDGKKTTTESAAIQLVLPFTYE